MKILLTMLTIMLAFSVQGQNQYCNVNTRPDYKELALHRQEPNYRPCSTMTKKEWFDAQFLRLERRLGKFMLLYPNDTRDLFLQFEELIPHFKPYHYTTENQYYLTVLTFENVDASLDAIDNYHASLKKYK